MATRSKFSSAPLSNTQFRPRRISSGNTVSKSDVGSKIPIVRLDRGHLIPIKRNARAGKLYHWNGGKGRVR